MRCYSLRIVRAPKFSLFAGVRRRRFTQANATVLPFVSVYTDEKSLAFIGNPRRAMLRWRAHLNCRGFSITRLEGSRWRLRRRRDYGADEHGRGHTIKEHGCVHFPTTRLYVNLTLTLRRRGCSSPTNLRLLSDGASEGIVSSGWFLVEAALVRVISTQYPRC